MKTLPLNIGISQLVMESNTRSDSPVKLLRSAQQYLNDKANQIGSFIHCAQSECRVIGSDLELESYDLRYERRTLRIRFACLRARGAWEVQGFQWVA